jgi:hypothetical protein
MAEEKKLLRSAGNSKLPMASEIPDEDTFQEVRALLKKALKLRETISEKEDELSDIKERLQAVCEAFSMSGFKHGLAGFQYDGFVTRKSLSKEALLAAGVAAQTIEDCYLEGKPFVSAKIIAFDFE